MRIAIVLGIAVVVAGAVGCGSRAPRGMAQCSACRTECPKDVTCSIDGKCAGCDLCAAKCDTCKADVPNAKICKKCGKLCPKCDKCPR